MLAQVRLWAALFAGLLWAAGAAKVLLTVRDSPTDRKTIAAAAFIVLAGVVICLFQLFPGPGPSFTSGWQDIATTRRIIRTIATVFRALVPIGARRAFLEHEHLDEIPIPKPSCVGMLGMMGWSGTAPSGVRVVFAGAVSLVTFTGLRFRGATRHHGYLFMR